MFKYIKNYMSSRDRKNIENANAKINNMAPIAEIAFVKMAESGSIDAVTASEHMSVFAPWEPNITYEVGNLRTYGEPSTLYKCIQSHISQNDWTPDEAVSLWVKASDPTIEFPDWSQPIGASDSYMSGDKVSHNDKHWSSDVDNNVWEPGVYGWSEVT